MIRSLLNACFFFMLAIALFPLTALAHSPSTSYLFVSEKQGELQLRWDIALRDLEQVIGLDTNLDQNITWLELKNKQVAISAYASANLDIRRDNTSCQVSHQALQVEEHSNGSCAVLHLRPQCKTSTGLLTLNYSLLFDDDLDHRGIILDQRHGNNTQPIIASPENRLIALDQPASSFQSVMSFTQQGSWHILIGFDHILFVLTLMLPAVLYYRKKHWQAVGEFMPALINLLKVITAFTVAHSITLSLATLEIVSLPSRWVESAIALSVVLVAINNIKPLFTHHRWSIAFLFGLIHGFGFASVLSDLDLSSGSLFLSLLGFNWGVEIGQGLILLLLFPIAYLLRKTDLYQTYIVKGGSLAISIVASFWLVQRVMY